MDKHKRFIKLGWELLRHKFHYYEKDAPIAEDARYDALEREYDALAKELGQEPTAANMVGFNRDRPSCQLVASRESRSAKQRKALIKEWFPDGDPVIKTDKEL